MSLHFAILQADNFIEISRNIYYGRVLINLSLKQFILEVLVYGNVQNISLYGCWVMGM